MREDDPHSKLPVLQAGAHLKDAVGAIILLHGRGASASDVLSLGHAFAPDSWALIAPEAAQHTWYPNSFLAPRDQNEPWLSSALRKVDRVIEGILSSGLQRQNLVIAGFSQGACLASEYAGTAPNRYGGVIVFTGGMIGPSLSSAPLPGTFGGTPALFASGDPDPHVPWERVEATAKRFQDAGADVALHRYPGRPHTVSREELLLAHELMKRI